ncbi:MAG: efflux RND transporter periplasmic adaptor subunit [Candidatus Doudnabacteria bacterium]|nr:efflux RND transporter periplasmic adaptor subunit [Candidatus Doudnabacteria bacterium]
MAETNSNNSAFIKKPWYKRWFTKKKIIIYIILLLVIGFFVIRSRKTDPNAILTDMVKKQDLKATVLATGQVVSETDLSLSFKTSGVVARVNVKVGDKVKAGQILANLEARDVAARLTQAQGTYQQAQANYQKVLLGATSEEVQVAQVTLDNAKKNLEDTKRQQQVLVDNAYKALLNSSLTAIAGPGNSGSVTISVTGAYIGIEQGQYQITISATGSGLTFQFNGLETGSGVVSSNPQPLGTKGLYIQFSSTSVPSNNIWTISIPNTQGTTYVTNYNAYQAALETQRSAITTAENTLNSAQAALDLKKAKARPVDLDAAQATITTALGQVQAAQSDLENSIIRAPADGTITSVDIKAGELATALKEAIILQDINNLHVEANVSEANIFSLKVGQSVDITFDSLGMDRKFIAKVQQIDPASTVVSGVVNYKITVGLDKIEEVKPGMTANLSILTDERKDVLAIPTRAVILKDNKKFARAVTDKKKKTYKEVEITTGLEADGGVVEVLSGLNEGEEIITFIKAK